MYCGAFIAYFSWNLGFTMGMFSNSRMIWCSLNQLFLLLYQGYIIVLWKECKKSLNKLEEQKDVLRIMGFHQSLKTYTKAAISHLVFMIVWYLAKSDKVLEVEWEWWLRAALQSKKMFMSLWKLLCAAHSMKDMGKLKTQLQPSFKGPLTMKVVTLEESS